jgi:tellurite resistance protein TerC
MATVPLWAWAVLAALLITFLTIDLLAHRGNQVDSRKRALVWSLVWIGAALAFNAFVFIKFGSAAGEQFFAAYILEKSLSVDNLFLFLVVFGMLGIPSSEQHRVLTWGIIGALVTRAFFIVAGIAAIQRWHEVTYVFGALLLLTSVKLLRSSEDKRPPKLRFLGWLERHLPWTPKLHGHHFIAKVDGRWVGTPLLVAMITIEAADIVFALDSIPAAFAVTDDLFILYSSNIFAVLGLRALYIVLAGALEGLRHLRFGLAAVLAFAGIKMLISSWIKVPPSISVAVIATCITIAVISSLVAARRDRQRHGKAGSGG